MIGSDAVSTCKTSVFLMVFDSRNTSELGEYAAGDGDDGTRGYFVVVVVTVVAKALFSISSLPMS